METDVINWILAGALLAVLLAEVADALALRQLTRQCLALRPKSRDEWRLVRWYAEGFDHSMAVTAWLSMGCLGLTAIALMCGAHPLVIAAGVLLAAAAHGEKRLGARLRRRVLQVRAAH